MSGMLLNGRTSQGNLTANGCSCHNTKQARRKVRKSIKAKAKATNRRDIRNERA